MEIIIPTKYLFDAILKLAANEAMQREMNALPSFEDLNRQYKPTDSLNKKICEALQTALHENTCATLIITYI